MSHRVADRLVDQLSALDVDRVFCVPGESYLAVLDALHDRNDIQVISCRHEGGAGFMAVADAKVTGRPGVCLVSRGPGATNASIALHTAEQDAVPLVLLIGQVARQDIGRQSFQEIDYGKMFGDIAKGVWTIFDPDQITDVIAGAFHVAARATPGPVVVVLPEDLLGEETAVPVRQPLPLPRPLPSGGDMADLAARLAASERPLMIIGGGIDSAAGRAAVIASAERFQLPVVTSFKRQDLFPNRHSSYAGHLGFGIPAAQVDLYRDADLIVAVGTRLGDVTTQGFRFPAAPEPDQPLVHVLDDGNHIGRMFKTDLGIVADPAAVLAALADQPPPQPSADRLAWAEKLHAYVVKMAEWVPPALDDGILVGHLVAALQTQLNDDAVFITDAGNFSGWLHRHFPFGEKNRLIGAVAGAMGLGMPAAVAAGFRWPDRQIITLIGDGGYLMTGNELATAVRHNVPVRAFVSNNNSYGTIRTHQEKFFPGRTVATELSNPDFAALAQAFGARGLTIGHASEVESVVNEALQVDGPVVIDMHIDLEQITAFASISQLAGRA